MEGNPEMGIHIVGCGGKPNSAGVIQCLQFGAVSALEG